MFVFDSSRKPEPLELQETKAFDVCDDVSEADFERLVRARFGRVKRWNWFGLGR